MMHPSINTAPASARSGSGSRATWAYAAAGLGFLATLLIFSDATLAMVSTWMNSSTFNHGPMIPALALYLAWRRREQVLAAPVRFEWLGLVAVAVALFVTLVGHFSATMIIQQFGLIFTLQALVLCVLGRHVVWQVLFPLFYLSFSVPFGAELVPPLQDITAFFVVSLLRLVGVPVFIDGVFITTPAGNYLVAEACAGLRYLISTIALSLVFANLTFSSWQRRALFIGLSLVVPVIANGVRAFLIVLVAYLSNNEIAAGIDHIIYGWVFFSIVTFLLFGLGYMMREPPDEEAAPAPMPAHGFSWVASACAAAAIVLMGALTAAFADAATNRAAVLDRPTAPEIAGFAKTSPRAESWLPRFAGADLQIDQSYERDGRPFALHIGLYARERQGAKAVTTGHDFAPSDMWKPGAPQKLAVATPEGPLAVTAVHVSGAGRYRVVWYWYWIGGEFTGSPYRAKYLRVRSLLTGGNVATAIVAISSEYPIALGEPTNLLREMATATPAIRAMLESAARGGK